ncbi:MAG: DUF805 domain-containing protein [Robiginitomaculum sp.]|nr:DUF805 domain-containing protein [Robiginitomaculum sp.]
MNFGESISTCFRKYFTFYGRASRSEYWWFMLFTVLAGIVLPIIDMSVFEIIEARVFAWTVADILPFSTIFNIVVFVPTIAVTARRLHDTSRSGWWQLIWLAPMLLLTVLEQLLLAPELLIPVWVLMLGEWSVLLTAAGVFTSLAFLGLFVLLIVWLATRGNEWPNKFGDDPLGEPIADVFS